MPTNVYQMVPIANPRDAIGRLVWNLSRLLDRCGYPNTILTEHQRSFFRRCRSGLDNPSLPAWSALNLPVPDTLVYHHSIGTGVAEHFVKLPSAKKILIYHGVTPSSLLAPSVRNHAEQGLSQLAKLASHAQYCIGFSDFICNELQAVGALAVLKLPYYLPLVRAHSQTKAITPHVVVVGRVVRHKRVLECIRAFKCYLAIEPGARLSIVGNLKSDPEYSAKVKHSIRTGGLQGSVKLLGKISERRLHRIYRRASVLLTLSEHEGFCVPVLEAMRYGLSIVANAKAALSETVGDAGVLVRDPHPELVALALNRCLETQHRQQLQENILKNTDRFDPARFEARFLALLRP